MTEHEYLDWNYEQYVEYWQAAERKKRDTNVRNNIIRELDYIYSAKNKDYGDSFHRSFEEFGLISADTRLL